jgi:hypothetical protein
MGQPLRGRPLGAKFRDFGAVFESRGTNFQPDKPNLRTQKMDTSKLMPLGIALAILYGVSKFVPNQMVKAAAFGAMGVIVAKQIPYVKEAL